MVTENLVRIWVDVGGVVGDDGSIFVVYKPEYSGELIGIYGVIVLFVTSSTCVLSVMSSPSEDIFEEVFSSSEVDVFCGEILKDEIGGVVPRWSIVTIYNNANFVDCCTSGNIFFCETEDEGYHLLIVRDDLHMTIEE